MPAQELPDGLSRVDAAAIPKQDDRSPDLPKQVVQEESHFNLRHVLPVEMQIEPDSLSSKADGNRRDRRDAVVPVAMPDDRCLAARRPGAANVRDQEEATLVQEGQVRLQPLRFFLMAVQRYRFQRSKKSAEAEGA